jgi:disulfide bond formation protein DsbB
MPTFVAGVIYAIGILTILIHVAIIFFIIATLQSATLREWLHERVGRHGVLVALSLIASAIIGSLFFSNIAGFLACFLCWVQRALLYPQIIFYGWYLYKPKKLYLYICLAMTIAGIIVSGYQVALENGLAGELVPCQAILSLTASCATKYINLFGYVTIPVMSLSAFVALLEILWVVLHRKHWLPAKAAKMAKLP